MKGAAGNDKRKQSKLNYIAAPLVHNREQSKVLPSLFMANKNHENVSSSGEVGQSTSILSTSTRTRSDGRVAPELEEEMCTNNNVLSKSGNFGVHFAEPLVTDTTFTFRPLPMRQP
jgi:hypothetical protein